MAAKVLGLSQPKVSALRNYKLAGFSVERLMTLLAAVDQDVEIVIRQKLRHRGRFPHGAKPDRGEANVGGHSDLYP